MDCWKVFAPAACVVRAPAAAGDASFEHSWCRCAVGRTTAAGSSQCSGRLRALWSMHLHMYITYGCCVALKSII